MAPKEHHFLLFRHCPRKTGESVVPLSGLPSDISNYVNSPSPNWGALGSRWCLQASEDIFYNTGIWMIESGMINPGQKIQWEMIPDDSTRDVDTAYYLTTGIYDELIEKFGEDFASFGEQTIKADSRFFYPTSEMCSKTYRTSEVQAEILDRLKHLPRPTLGFTEALQMLQQLAGIGKLGDLTELLSDEPEYDASHGELDGSVSVLAEAAEMMFFTRAGGLEHPYIPKANKQQVFEFLQFEDYMRSVTKVENSKAATHGAPQVQAMMRVLAQGYYSSPATPDEDYDTRVTVFVGHDGDLDTMATALGVRWILQEPYISGKDGAFLPTPPMSGIHAVRRFDEETDRIDLSFVYPMYAQADSAKFVLNTTGILEHTPLIFQDEFKGASMDDRSTHITAHGSKSSLKLLEEHILNVLSSYNRGAAQCYHSSAKYWAAQDAKRQQVLKTASGTTDLAQESLIPAVTIPQNIYTPDSTQTVPVNAQLSASQSFSREDLMTSFGIGIVAGMSNVLLFWLVYRFFSRRRRQYRRLCWSDDCTDTDMSCTSDDSSDDEVETAKLV